MRPRNIRHSACPDGYSSGSDARTRNTPITPKRIEGLPDAPTLVMCKRHADTAEATIEARSVTRYVYLRFEVDEDCTDTDTDAEIEQQVEDVFTEVAPKSWTWDPMGQQRHHGTSGVVSHGPHDR